MKNLFLMSTALILMACEPQIEQALPPQTGPVDAPAAGPIVRPASTTPQNIAQTPPAPQPVSRTKTQTETPFNVKRCLNLANSLESPIEGEWGLIIKQSDIQTIKNAGFDTVRLPVRWDTHMSRSAPYAVKPAYMARVAQVVRQAQDAGLGVVLDVHHYEDLVANPRRNARKFYALWEQIATYFADAPDTVYFELFNEPTNVTPMDDVNTLYNEAVKIIRKSNPKRIIIMGGNSWNSIDTIGQVDWTAMGWPNDPNIVATYHDYGPHEFTHQGATWTQPVMPLGRKWGGRADEAEFKDTFEQARAFKAQTGLRVFVGEFGVINKVPLSERNAWMKARRKAMEASGITWCAWDYSASFNIYDVDSQTWLPGSLDALMGR